MKYEFPLPDLVAAQADEAADALRSIAHPGRLRVLCYLADDGELSAGELTRRVGLSQSALSQHLARLREQGIVSTRKLGQSVFYRIAEPRVARLLRALREIYCTALPVRGADGDQA